MEQRTNEYRKAIADAFVKSLQENALEWKKGWNSTMAAPQNAISGKNYKGLNRFYLTLYAMSHNTADPRWATFKQIQDKGWRLNKGAKGMKVEYWTPYDYQNKKNLQWEEYNKLLNDPERRKQIGVVAKYYHVFNGQDITGIPELQEQPERAEAVSDQIIDTISRNMGVEIANEGGDRAYYNISEDKIFLPPKTAFLADYEYNATALHELSHATGAVNRLNRDLKNQFGTEKYAYEELVAEISSCFMGEHLQVQQTAEHMENHKAYVKSWIKEISEKPATLMKAIRDAENCANYLEYQAELISEKEYQKTLSGTKEVEPDDLTSKEAVEESEVDKGVFRSEKAGQEHKVITQEIYENMMSDGITSVEQDFTNCLFRDVKFNWFRPQMPYADQPVVDVVDFHRADFTGSRFVNCDFSSVSFRECSFEKCSIRDCMFSRNHISHCNFSRAWITDTRMNDICMVNNNLYKANIFQTNIANSQLMENNFFGVSIHGDPNLKDCFAVRNRHVDKIDYSFWVWRQYADPVLGVQDQERVSGVSDARQKELYEDFNRSQRMDLTEKECQLVENWEKRWNAYIFGGETLRKREQAIAEDIRMAGWRPTNGLVDHVIRLEQIAGKAYTLENICVLCKKPRNYRLEDIQKSISKSDEAIFHKALDGIAHECKQQELAWMRAVPQAAPTV